MDELLDVLLLVDEGAPDRSGSLEPRSASPFFFFFFLSPPTSKPCASTSNRRSLSSRAAAIFTAADGSFNCTQRTRTFLLVSRTASRGIIRMSFKPMNLGSMPGVGAVGSEKLARRPTIPQPTITNKTVIKMPPKIALASAIVPRK